MKKLIIILAILLFTSTNALALTSQSFLWNANSESDLAGYRIYRNSTGVPFEPGDEIADIPCAPGDDTCCTYNDQDIPDGTYYWVARAYDMYDNESANSTVLTKTFDTARPQAPSGFHFWQMIISWVKTFFSWFA